MTSRNRRGNRRANMKARIGVAAAVLIGGGAAGVAVVAANNHGPSSTTASDAGFIMGFHHRISQQTALSSALSMWSHSHQGSMTTLAQMVPMRTFTQVWAGSRHHRTMFAAQRGVVVLATKNFLVVKSANGGNHLWWLTGKTAFQNVTASPTGMTAMTGNNTAAVNAMVKQNTVTAQQVMAGSTNVVAQAAAPTKPTTITIVTGTETITITITPTSAVVTQPSATTSTTPTGMPSATPTGTTTVTATPTATPTVTATTATPTPSVTATQPVTTATHGVAAGDLVMVAGVREHGRLIAQLVLFSAPTTVTPTASPSVTVKASSTVTAVPTTTTGVPTAPATISGTKS
jgi:hypothetical protein